MMPVKATTVYTKEQLLRYHYTVMRSKTVLWVALITCTALVFACYLLLQWMGEPSAFVQWCTLLVVLLDIVYAGMALVLPRLTVSKAKSLGAQITYTFEEEEFCVEGESVHTKESATVRYTIFSKVIKRKDTLYLFISNQRGYIVDLSALPAEQIQALKDLLCSKVPQKAFRWK